MDAEQREMIRLLEQDQDENGVDLFWLRYNLSLTLEERIEKHRRGAETVLVLRDAARRAGYRKTG